jgi:hypothetical protein
MRNGDDSNRKTIITGVVLLASLFILNYLFERHNIFKVWENSGYPISLADPGVQSLVLRVGFKTKGMA